jgi:AcrR family transcriptional regulator
MPRSSRTPGRRKASSSYHHGQLREALIAAGLGLLEQRGGAKLSLRETARSVGVSPMAAYHHFADKDALLAAIVAAGFAELAARQARASARAPSPGAALLALGRVYVESARERPELFRLMAGRDLLTSDATSRHAVRVAFDLLRRHVRDWIGERDAATYAAGAWAVAHGISILLNEGLLRPGEDGLPSERALVNSVLELVGRGIRAREPGA